MGKGWQYRKELTNQVKVLVTRAGDPSSMPGTHTVEGEKLFPQVRVRAHTHRHLHTFTHTHTHARTYKNGKE